VVGNAPSGVTLAPKAGPQSVIGNTADRHEPWTIGPRSSQPFADETRVIMEWAVFATGSAMVAGDKGGLGEDRARNLGLRDELAAASVSAAVNSNPIEQPGQRPDARLAGKARIVADYWPAANRGRTASGDRLSGCCRA